MARDLSILICGDICPTADTRYTFDKRNVEDLFGGLAERIRRSDIALANLECVLTDQAQPIEKIGPVLTGRPADANFLAEAGFNLVGLANNHIGDCGPAGVIDTLNALDGAGLRRTGAGHTAAEAAIPAIIESDGWRIGVAAIAEHEFNAAGPASAGAHIFDPLTDLERIRTLKADIDFLIVLYHGGIEFHPYPSPLLQRTCRAFVRNGADLVLCQHSHVIGTFEKYQSGHILYGQGNSVFGYRPDNPGWNEGLAVDVRLRCGDDPAVEIELLPIGCDPSGKVDILGAVQAKVCLEALDRRSGLAEDPAWVEAAWETFCARLSYNELPHVLGLGVWPTRLNRLLRGGLVKLLYPRRNRMTAMNVLRCDAHREVLMTAFRQSLRSAKLKNGK